MPNLHPMVIHFPIALLIVGFLFDLFGLFAKQDWAKRAGLVLIVLGAAGGLAALLTGSAAEEAVEHGLSGAGEAMLESHEEVGQWTAYLWLALAALRAAVATPWLKRVQTPAFAAYLVAAAVGLGMLTLTAYRGGELVYAFGGGVGLDGGATIQAPAEDHDD